jgi:hypothetical protein
MTLTRSCGRALVAADRPGAAGRAQPFTIEIRDGHSQLQDSSPSAPADLVVTISAADLIRLRRGSLTVRQATKTGGMEYRAADRARVDAFALEHSP